MKNVGDLLASKSGNFGLLTALMLPVLVLSAGVAIDTANIFSAREALQHAVDDAVLAASKTNENTDERRATFERVLAAGASNGRTLYNVAGDIDFKGSANSLQATGKASADVKLAFLGRFNFADLHLDLDAVSYQSTQSLEVAMVLDNTGSLGANGIKQLRTAAKSLTEILRKQSEKRKKDNGQEKPITAALVPFVTAVNVRNAEWNPKWLSGFDHNPTTAQDSAYVTGGVSNWHLFADLANADQDEVWPESKYLATGTGDWHDGPYAADSEPARVWKGCVEARAKPYNLDDAPPSASDPETLFTPYFAPDEPGKARPVGNSSKYGSSAGNDADYFNNSYLADDILDGKEYDHPGKPSYGEYEFDGADAVADQRKRQSNVTKYTSASQADLSEISETGSLTNGPNRACPSPIVPLTDDFDGLESSISAMNYFNGSGTNVSEGLAWGERVLSPAEPFTGGGGFNDDKVSKAVVLFTDGENAVFGAQKAKINKSDYGAYGYLDSNRFDTTSKGTAVSHVDDWTKTVCANLRSKNVDIYAVLLNADTNSNRKLYRDNCVTDPANYYAVDNASDLESVFKDIGNQLTQLYLMN
ncbi:TadE/TadG family type IV pilus assembly protein [Pararhizobium mangrovi]|uniref:VWFA domain-containing protein n=1 Tax=Pararhizobium mangrovi TaxID=2590452 RepID=A0A506TZV2_9HYPH|nr:pilus assembly protein [Pararhizobium mangrovi]TPW26274.1 hypothetical protein FJU11_15515 [Pararhizobium mangrovi]